MTLTCHISATILGILRWVLAEFQIPPCSATVILRTANGPTMNVRAAHSVSHPRNVPESDDSLYQNLLRTLTESQVKTSQQHTNLKLLLSAVKETRVSASWICDRIYLTSSQKQSQDATKLADAFYDSLEGLLHDLRTVTMVSIHYKWLRSLCMRWRRRSERPDERSKPTITLTRKGGHSVTPANACHRLRGCIRSLISSVWSIQSERHDNCDVSKERDQSSASTVWHTSLVFCFLCGRSGRNESLSC